MKHFGDIARLDGRNLPTVDVITGGSPCQDLSIAGKREGLQGARSGLFMEQIRIIREMRKADEEHGRAGIFIRPRYMVWENVPGAFSSNGGRDFQKVLTETVRIAEPNAPDVPLPEKGKWPKAGVLMGDGWSIAWRVLDAQYWGVPQRRRRIALVADFGGASAGEILFERKGFEGNQDPCGETGESAPANSGKGGRFSDCDVGNAGCHPEREYANDGTDGAYPGVVRTIPRRMDGSPCVDRRPEVVVTYDARGNGDGQTVNTITGDHENRITDYTACLITMLGYCSYALSDTARALRAAHDITSGDLVCAVDCRNMSIDKQTNGTLQAKSSGGISLNTNNVIIDFPVVRRLTPTECELLQGFPQGWTDIGDYTDTNGRKRKTSDTARYKALGNSIALPPWEWLLERIAKQYNRPATMGSLFDGISGFPLLWERISGQGTALWASEIEDFPIAASKKHFGS